MRNQLSMAIIPANRLTIFYGSLLKGRGKARYQYGHSAQYSGFKLTTTRLCYLYWTFIIIKVS